jgi:hypothetical protein
LTINHETGRKSSGWREQLHRFAVDRKHANVIGRMGMHLDPVVRGGTNGVGARLEPLEPCKRKPAIGLRARLHRQW